METAGTWLATYKGVMRSSVKLIAPALSVRESES